MLPTYQPIQPEQPTQQTYNSTYQTMNTDQTDYFAQTIQSSLHSLQSPPDTVQHASHQLQSTPDTIQHLSQHVQSSSHPLQSTSYTVQHTQKTPLRRSPRKSPRKLAATPDMADANGMVRLLAKSETRVDQKQLRKAIRAATETTSEKAGYKLASYVLRLLFSEQELAISCGQGLRQKKGDVRPALDSGRIEILKDYVTAWCRMNGKGFPRDSDINDAINEQVSYARKLTRKT